MVRRLVIFVAVALLIVCLSVKDTGCLENQQIEKRRTGMEVANFDPTPERDLYQHPSVYSLDRAAQCSDDQLKVIEKQLGLLTRPCQENDWGGCGICKATQCPNDTWLQDYYKDAFKSRTDNISFVGVSIGCNKGYDAINTARMGMNDPAFDKSKWKEAIIDKIPDKGACKQAEDSQFEIFVDQPVRSGEMHCVEPVPSTTQVLEAAADSLGLGGDKSKFVLSKAAISSSNGSVKFPSAGAGTETFGIDGCYSHRAVHCEDVPMYSLQNYVNKFVKSKGPINILSIDVEGFDFEVLFGAGDVLDRAEYVEFEYHVSGNWKRYHLMDAVSLLDTKGYTCYWSGKGKLWRLTECNHDVYSHWHGWSNVACVHRSQKVLARKMENLFLDTLKEGE